MKAPAWTIIRGGRILDPARRRADPADLLLRGERIEALGPPGLEAPAEAVPVDATDRLLLPGLVNAHTHGHGSLGKGTGDRWNLELLLNAVGLARQPYHVHAMAIPGGARGL